MMAGLTEVQDMAVDRGPLPPQPDRASLLAAFRAVRDGLMTNDPARLRELYAEDFRSHTIRGDIEGREAVLEAFKPGGVRLDMFEAEDLAVELNGEVGILTGLGSISGRYETTEFRHRVRFVDIFLWRDGRWRYHFSQSTEVMPEAA
jgi:ketosteroid isomerase-like protein